ncbi:MAG: ATPase, T2SS/T4P/T4SS family, partial [Acidimicrobiia bacterium]|nr:ATPase, T2SS/T4P/T4SS family [Acidimicrobiia bacterium]
MIERIVRRVIESDLSLDRAGLERAIPALLEEEAPLAPPETATAVIDALIGMGPIEPLLRDEAVSDVLINGPQEVWIERGGRLERTAVRFADGADVAAAVERIIGPLGLRIDRASPTVDARLPDGSRLHATLPPVAVDGPVVAIRRFTQAIKDLADLVNDGAIDEHGAARLRRAVIDRENILISGGTGTGKTTLLNVLSREIPSGERVVTVEDAAELSLAGHVVRLEARPANSEGRGEIGLRHLVRVALRLRPDRIILGEVRGSEALDLVAALNTGHRGSMSTVHANSPEEALLRLETLALLDPGGFESSVIRRQLHAAIDMIVQMSRDRSRRVVHAIATVGDLGLTEWSG